MHGLQQAVAGMNVMNGAQGLVSGAMSQLAPHCCGLSAAAPVLKVCEAWLASGAHTLQDGAVVEQGQLIM